MKFNNKYIVFLNIITVINRISIRIVCPPPPPPQSEEDIRLSRPIKPLRSSPLALLCLPPCEINCNMERRD